MNANTVFRLSSQFATTSAVVLTVFALAGPAEAANTVRTQLVAPKAPVASKVAVKQRQIAIEPRLQQPPKTLTTFQVTPKAPVVNQGNDSQTAQIPTSNIAPVEAPAKVASVEEAPVEPAIQSSEPTVAEQPAEKPPVAVKKVVDINNLAEGDRLFEDNNQYIVFHSDGTYDTVAKVAKKVEKRKAYVETYSPTYYSDSYNNYTGSYSYAPSYSNYGYSDYGYANCQ